MKHLRTRWPAGAGDAGDRLELPATGPGSAATEERRVYAALFDWVIFVALASITDLSDNVALGGFALTQIVLPWLFGVTPGKLAFGLRLARVADPGRRGVPLPAAVVRPLTLWGCQPVTTAVWMFTRDAYGRTAQDRLCRTIVLSTR